MKKLTENAIAQLRNPSAKLAKIDYTMNTCYYRVLTEDGEVLGASVDPRTAIGYLTPESNIYQVEL